MYQGIARRVHAPDLGDGDCLLSHKHRGALVAADYSPGPRRDGPRNGKPWFLCANSTNSRNFCLSASEMRMNRMPLPIFALRVTTSARAWILWSLSQSTTSIQVGGSRVCTISM